MRYLLYIPTGTAITFGVYEDEEVIDLDLFIKIKNRESDVFSNVENIIHDVVKLMRENPVVNIKFITRNDIQLPADESDFTIVERE
jgi:hypothetical protein